MDFSSPSSDFYGQLAAPASRFGHENETCRRHFKTGALHDGSGGIFSLEVSAIPCKAAQSPALLLLLLLRVFKLSFEVTSDIFKASKPLHEKRSCEPSLPDRLAALTGGKKKKKDCHVAHLESDFARAAADAAGIQKNPAEASEL